MKLGVWIVEWSGINECNRDVSPVGTSTGGFRHELVEQLADGTSRCQTTSGPMASYAGGLRVCRNPCRCWLCCDGPCEHAPRHVLRTRGHYARRGYCTAASLHS